MFDIPKLPMPGFEHGSSGIGSYHAITTTQLKDTCYSIAFNSQTAYVMRFIKYLCYAII